MSLFCFLALYLHPFGHLMGRLSCLWGVSSLKEARFSRAWGPWTRKRWCLVSSGATYHVFLNRSGAHGHAENDHLACLPLALGARPAKKRPIKFDIKLGSAT